MDADRADALLADQPLDLFHGFVGVVDERIRLGPRHQRSVGAVAAVGEPLGDEGEAVAARGFQLRVWQPDYGEVELGGGDHEQVGGAAVAARLVVQRSVRLDVPHLQPSAAAIAPSAPNW